MDTYLVTVPLASGRTLRLVIVETSEANAIGEASKILRAIIGFTITWDPTEIKARKVTIV